MCENRAERPVSGLILFHGSRAPARLRVEGFRLVEDVYRADAGDFGRGVYLTASRERAASYGEVVEVRVSARARFVQYDSMSEAYDEVELIAGGPTCRGSDEERRARSERVTRDARRWRVDGFRIHERECRDYEVVVFDPALLTVIA
jgi:hypothetical protein